MGVGVVAVETETTERRSDEREVALVGGLNTEHTGIVGIHVLGNLKLIAVAGKTEL